MEKPAKRPATKTGGKKPAKPKAMSIQMSTQAKMFLASLDPKERDGFLDVIGKIASGKLKGKRVNMSELSPEDRKIIEASSREFIGKKPVSA